VSIGGGGGGGGGDGGGGGGGGKFSCYKWTGNQQVVKVVFPE